MDYIAHYLLPSCAAMNPAHLAENPQDITSGWPLPSDGVRILLPPAVTKLLHDHPLSRDLYPLAAGFYPHAAGHSMRRRKHADNLLAYCADGAGKLRTEQGEWTVRAGDLMLLPAGVAHSYAADRAQPWSLYWTHYEGAASQTFIDLLGLTAPVAPIGLQPRLIADFEALFALRNAGFNERVFVRAACQLKTMIADIACLAELQTSGGGARIDLDHIQQLMHRRLDGELDLDDLARAANLSKFHFIRRFKQLTGHTPIQHFIHLKMQHACRLLDTTHEPVKRIAAQVGYDDPHYFSRLFKRVLGVSPQHYRQHRLA